MSDVIMTDEDGVRYSYENIKTQGWLDGHMSGLDMAVVWLKARAIDLFTDGKHEAAISMQKLADTMKKDLQPKMEASARRHEKEFPCIVDEENP